ncbi:MAG TPA: preprotein translocase subunit SecE [Erysipelothrix sp.]|nr:preprotein translocase subunit SecE [Erysipelothrix sp.]
MSWLTISGIKEEIKKISWPKRKEIGKSTTIVVGFLLFFAAYFMITEVVLVWVLKNLLQVGL